MIRCLNVGLSRASLFFQFFVVSAFQTLFVSERERVETSERSPILSLAAVVGYLSFERGRYTEIPYYYCMSLFKCIVFWKRCCSRRDALLRVSVLLVLMSYRPKGLLRSSQNCPQPAASRFPSLHLAWFLVGGGGGSWLSWCLSFRCVIRVSQRRSQALKALSSRPSPTAPAAPRPPSRTS